MRQPDSDHLRGMLLAAGGMILISPDGLLIRLVSASPLQIVFWRGLFNFMALGLFLQLALPSGLPAALRRGGRAGLLCAALFASAGTFFVLSITHTAVANSLVILSAIPLFGALLGWIFLRERVRLRTWLAMAAAIGGILIVFSGAVDRGGMFGNLSAVVAALAVASALTVSRANPRVSMQPSICLGGFLVALVWLPFSHPFEASLHDIGLLAVMGIMAQSLAMGLFLRGGRYLPPAETGLFTLVETILGPLWVWLGIGEVPTTNAFAGGAVVIVALVVHSLLSLRRGAHAPAAVR